MKTPPVPLSPYRNSFNDREGAPEENTHNNASRTAMRVRTFVRVLFVLIILVAIIITCSAMSLSRPSSPSERENYPLCRRVLSQPPDFVPHWPPACAKDAGLLQAVKEDKPEWVKRLLADASPDVSDSNGNSPLHLALLEENWDMFNLLTSEGTQFDINTENNEGKTPLYIAFEKRNLDAAERLINLGAIVDVDSAGDAPLQQAQINRDPFMTELLMYAAEMSNTRIIMFLSEKGVDPKAVDSEGKNALMYAAKSTYPNTEIVIEMLISMGIDPKAVDHKGKDALMHAAENSHPNAVTIIKKLISKGVDLKAVDSEGKNALMYVVRSPEAVEKLIQIGADINASDRRRKNVLMYAAEHGRQDVVEILIKAGADIAAVDSEGKNVLMYAADNAFPVLVNRLIKAGIDPRAKTLRGETAYTLAERKGTMGHKAVMQVLRVAINKYQ